LTIKLILLHLERCYAALGDVSKARFLRETLNAADGAAEVYGGAGLDTPVGVFTHFNDSYFQENMVVFIKKDVIARLCILDKRFKAAESIYLEHSQLDEAIEVSFLNEIGGIIQTTNNMVI